MAVRALRRRVLRREERGADEQARSKAVIVADSSSTAEWRGVHARKRAWLYLPRAAGRRLMGQQLVTQHRTGGGGVSLQYTELSDTPINSSKILNDVERASHHLALDYNLHSVPAAP